MFRLEAFLPEYPHIRVSKSIDNPLAIQPMTALERERASLEQDLAAAQYNGTLDNHIDDMVHLAQVLQQLGRYELALKWITSAIKRSGRDGNELQSIKASIHFSLGENDAAHKIWSEQANKQKGNSVTALNAAVSAPNLVMRERYIRQAVTAAPGDGVAAYFLAGVHNDKGEHQAARTQLERARQLLESAVQTNPQSLGYLYYLAATYDQLGQTARAADSWQRYRKLKEDAPIVANDALVGLTTDLALR